MSNKSEDIFRWVQIGFFVSLMLTSFVAVGPDGIEPRVKLYYYGMVWSQKLTGKSRQIESWFMNRYFEEVNQ